MTRTRTTIFAVALTMGGPAPLAAQAPADGWFDVARVVGGSGLGDTGRYVRLVPSRAWTAATPPAWLEFRRHGDRSILRGTVPALRGRARDAVTALRRALPAGAAVQISDTFGATSPRVHVRFLAEGPAVALAVAARRALEEIEPGALARIDTTGIVEPDSFECEEGFVVRTCAGERVDVGVLPPALQREGARVRLVARRKSAGRSHFLYYGSTGNWRTVAAPEQVTALPATATPHRAERAERGAERAAERGTGWFEDCREHARALLAGVRHRQARLETPLASGFERIDSPGFRVCPCCQGALSKDWLFADTGHDRVAATLHACAGDGLYFLGRDGSEHGPFFPDLAPEEHRR